MPTFFGAPFLTLLLLPPALDRYDMNPSGLAPEIWWFDDASKGGDPYVKANDAFSLLRPETVESLFYLWRVTRDEEWREAGWRIFCRFEEHARLGSGAFASLEDVTKANGGAKRDTMETFWLGETLKYLFLLFDDEEIFPIDGDIVFNTEAHPLPILV